MRTKHTVKTTCLCGINVYREPGDDDLFCSQVCADYYEVEQAEDFDRIKSRA